MKKALIVLLALIVVFTFAACGDNGSSGNTPPDNGTSTEQPSEPEQPKVPTQNLVYKKEGSTYTVTDYTGDDINIVIPEEYEGLPVTKIQGEHGTGAFARQNIVSVVIPDSITEIGQNSFNNCSELESVRISENSNLIRIGNNAFSGNSSLKSFYIPVRMTELGDSVFNNCGALGSISVAESNTAYRSENGHLIERSTQTLIRGANNGNVPESVKTIAQAAFRKANDITELYIPSSVETIGNYIIADSTIEKINYAGTQSEWEQIQKARMWNYGKESVELSFEAEAPTIPDNPVEDNEEITAMYLYINGNKLEVTLAENRAVTALIEILKQGDITYSANDYGGFEKVGSLGHSLPTDNSQVTTQSGDVVLYSGNQIVIFYGSNSWSYTRLGKINGYSDSELRTLLSAGNGNVQIRISLK